MASISVWTDVLDARRANMLLARRATSDPHLSFPTIQTVHDQRRLGDLAYSMLGTKVEVAHDGRRSPLLAFWPADARKPIWLPGVRPVALSLPHGRPTRTHDDRRKLTSAMLYIVRVKGEVRVCDGRGLAEMTSLNAKEIAPRLRLFRWSLEAQARFKARVRPYNVRISPEHLVACGMMLHQEKKPWYTRKQAELEGRVASIDLLREMIFDRLTTGRKVHFGRHLAQAQQMLSWLRAMPTEGTPGFLLGASHLASAQTLGPQEWGLLLAAIPAYREVRRSLHVEQEQLGALRHVGIVGEHIHCEVKVESVRSNPGKWGMVHRYRLRDLNDNLLTWQSNEDIPHGTWWMLDGQVKEHVTDALGVPATRVYRAHLSAIEDA